MIFSVFASWFNEVGYRLHVSFEVRLLIHREMKKMLNEKFNFESVRPGRKMKIIITTGVKHLNTWTVAGGFETKPWLEYIFWMPHDLINNAETPAIAFTEYFFKALVEVLGKYNIPEDDINQVKQIVLNELINNSEKYVYVDELAFMKGKEL